MSGNRQEFERRIQVQGRIFRLQVETSDSAADYAKYDALRQDIWGFAEDHLPSDRNLMCENFLHEGSSLIISVTDCGAPDDPPGRGERLAGFCYGFVGIRDKTLGFRSPDNLWFYSQYTGVKEEYRSYGLGVRIKEFQAEILRDVFGITVVVCTYDPLTAVNARRNVHHFGMRVKEYRVATYGEYGGCLNRRDIPSDRFFMIWDVTKSPGRVSVQGVGADTPPALLEFATQEIPGRSGPLSLEIVRGVRTVGGEDLLSVPVPSDFYRMLRETDVDDPAVRRIPLDWRLATRRVFQELFARGYAVKDFVGGGRLGPGCYLCSRRDP